MPESIEDVASSTLPTWEFREHTTKNPGRANRWSAIWLHIVPVTR